jgi:hypothetical protein
LDWQAYQVILWGVWSFKATDNEVAETKRKWYGSWVSQNGKVIVSENRDLLLAFCGGIDGWEIREFPGTINAEDFLHWDGNKIFYINQGS